MKLTKLSLCFALASGLAGGLSGLNAQVAQPAVGVQTIRVEGGVTVNGHAIAPQEQGAARQIQVEGKKLIIVGADGKQQEIEIPNSGSITVTSQADETSRDGKVERKVVGKAVIVGPDGQKQEIELDATGGFGFVPGKLLPVLPAGMAVSKYFIGVHCEPVDEETRAKLRLGENKGLQVLEVTSDSPAETAGLKNGDILLYANDTELGNREQLIEAVQKAGESQGELAFSIVRDELEAKVVVRPAERPEMQAIPGMMGGIEIFGEPGQRGDDLDELRKQMEQMKVQIFRAVPGDVQEGFAIPMPGIIREGFESGFGPEELEQFRAQMAEARQQLDQARAEMEKAQVQIREEMQRAQKEIRQQLDEARKQLERAVEELRKTKGKADDQ
jgi:membrane-associated protease RseP (regulator of RpoE activity)